MPAVTVVNVGLAGNAVLTNGGAANGLSALNRFDHDALGFPGGGAERGVLCSLLFRCGAAVAIAGSLRVRRPAASGTDAQRSTPCRPAAAVRAVACLAGSRRRCGT